MARIHVILAEDEKARYQNQAEREGKSLGAWLREAAEDRLTAAAARDRIGSVDDLHRFFQDCDAHETHPEPDWQDQERVIQRSRSSGLEVT
jgi:hypothetical protein